MGSAATRGKEEWRAMETVCDSQNTELLDELQKLPIFTFENIAIFLVAGWQVP